MAIQGNISVATEADEKSARQMDKSCVTGHFVLSWSRRTLSINMKPQNLWFKHCLSVLITEKFLKITLYG